MTDSPTPPMTDEQRAREILAATYEGAELAHLRQVILTAPGDEMGQWFHHAIAAIASLLSELATMREALARVRKALDYVPPAARKETNAAILADLEAGLSLRVIAKKHGVGVGRVRGAKARAALSTHASRESIDGEG